MVSKELSEGISQTLEILHNVPQSLIDKIPKKFLEFMEKNKSKTNVSRSQLKEKTKDLLAIIYMNYWCNEQEKNEYISILNKNERNYQKSLREKYNPDDLFKKNCNPNVTNI